MDSRIRGKNGGACPRLHVGRFFAGMTEGEAPIRDAPKEPGNGNVACYDVEILRLRFAPLGMTGGCGNGVGWCRRGTIQVGRE